MTTSISQHLRMVVHRTNTDAKYIIEEKDSRQILRKGFSSNFKKTITLFFFAATISTFISQHRINNVSGYINHICRVDSTNNNDIMDEHIKTLVVQDPNISQTIEKIKKKFPAEAELIIKIIKKLNTFTEPQDLKELNFLNSVLECFLLSLKKDKEEIITKITSGHLEGDVFTYNILAPIFKEAKEAYGNTTETLKNIFGLLGGDSINFEEMRLLLIKYFLIDLGNIDFFEHAKKHDNEIKKMFAEGDKNKHGESLKKLRNREEEMSTKMKSIFIFGNSLLLGQKDNEYKKLLEQFSMFNTITILFYDCLDSLIESRGYDSANNSIKAFISEYRKDFNDNEEVFVFNEHISYIIRRFKCLSVISTNESLKLFVNNIEDKFPKATYEVE